nr:unnamed protein product [Callosobruchus analis]
MLNVLLVYSPINGGFFIQIYWFLKNLPLTLENCFFLQTFVRKRDGVDSNDVSSYLIKTF